MAFVRVEESDASFSYGGGWSSTNDPAASGGTYHSTTGTNVLTITVPTGKTCALLIIRMSSDGGACVVALDAVTQYTFNTNNLSGIAAGNLADDWYQTFMPPIILASGAGHTITVTPTGSGIVVIDAILLADTSNAFVPATYLDFVHSQYYGFTENSPLISTRIVPSIGDQVATLLGTTGYPWTHYNQSIPGEDLTNGAGYQNVSVSGRLTAGTITASWMQLDGAAYTASISFAYNASLATINAAFAAASPVIPYNAVVPNLPNTTTPFSQVSPVSVQFIPNSATEPGRLDFTPSGLVGGTLTNSGIVNPQWYANGYSPEPGFRRAMLGAEAASPVYYTWGFNSFSQAFGAGQTQGALWHAAKPEIAYIAHIYNDEGYSGPGQLIDAPGFDNVGSGNSGRKQKQILSTTAALTGGLWTIAGPGGTTAATSYSVDLPTINARLAAASIPFTATAIPATGALFSAANTVTFTANAYGTQTPALSLPANSLTGGTMTMAGPNPAGRPSLPANALTGVARWKKRLQDMLWVMQFASPNTTIIVGSSFLVPSESLSASFAMAAAAASLCDGRDATIKNAHYCDLLHLADRSGGRTGYSFFQQAAFNPGNQSGHPTSYASTLIGTEIYRTIQQVRRKNALRTH